MGEQKYVVIYIRVKISAKVNAPNEKMKSLVSILSKVSFYLSAEVLTMNIVTICERSKLFDLKKNEVISSIIDNRPKSFVSYSNNTVIKC